MNKFLSDGRVSEFWEILKDKIEAKQDKLSGAAGQVVGFDENGVPTAQSPDGLSGSQGFGACAFQVREDGHLIMSYTGGAPPNMEIRDDGHLYLTIN